MVKSSVDHFIETYALLDNGSTNTFCSDDLIEELHITTGVKEVLSLTTLEKANNSIETTVVSLDVSDLDGNNFIHIPHVYVKHALPINVTVVGQEEIDRWPHLAGLVFPSVILQKVTLLIGQDVPEALIPLEVRIGDKQEPYATRTALGWSINGPVSMSLSRNHRAVVNYVHVDPLVKQVEQFWRIEASEMLAEEKTGMSVNDQVVVKTWNDTISRVDGHYQMAIPFKTDPPDLPCNQAVAARRLESLRRRLDKDQKLHAKYCDGMKEFLDKGYAVEAQSNNPMVSECPKWYLPHHPVINPNKPDKICIVYDCAAKYRNTSLNEQVFKGPDLMNSLIGVLLRFREHPIAMMADVEAMFHQVKVIPEHQDVLRILWWPNGDLKLEPSEYKMTVHLFGGVWSPSCANFALQKTAHDNHGEFDQETVTTVLTHFYVDDCLKYVSSEEEGIRLSKQLCDLLQRGGFRLTKWISLFLRRSEQKPSKTSVWIKLKIPFLWNEPSVFDGTNNLIVLSLNLL